MSPYIKPQYRPPIDEHIYALASFIQSPGELNYAITMLIHEHLHTKGKNYDTLNEIVGALECVKAEFLRRVVAPYEDIKLKENGDVE